MMWCVKRLSGEERAEDAEALHIQSTKCLEFLIYCGPSVCTSC
jgi:hypothetical protein